MNGRTGRTGKTGTYRRRKAGWKRKGMLALVAFIVLVGIVAFRFTAQPAIAGDREPEPRYKYYTSICVEPGDSLWTIAEDVMSEDFESIYSCIEEIKEINHLSGDFLRSGTKLCVPYYSAERK
jgi:hypothetical protein